MVVINSGIQTGLRGFFRIYIDPVNPEKSCQSCLFSHGKIVGESINFTTPAGVVPEA
jgi:hypothetical protein